MKYTLLFLLTLKGFLFANAQYDELGGLKKNLAKAKTDLEKVLALGKIMSYYSSYQIRDSVKFYAEKIRILGEESDDPAVKMQGYNSYGIFLIENRELVNDTIRKKRAQEYFNKWLQLAIAIKDKSNEGWAHFSLAFSSLSKEQHMDEALMANNVALEDPGNDSLYIYSCLRLAIAHGDFRNYKHVYINLDKALVRAVEKDNPVWLRSVYKYLREFYSGFGDAEKEWEMIEKLSEVTKKNYTPRYKIEDLRAKGYFIRQQSIGAFNYKARLAGTQSENTYDREKLDQSLVYLLDAFDLLKKTRIAIRNEELSLLCQNIFWTYFWMNKPEKIVEWQNSDSALINVWKTKRGPYYNINRGAYFFLTNQYDSATVIFDSCVGLQLSDRDLYNVYFLLLHKKGDTNGMIRLLETTKKLYSGRNIFEVQSALLALDSLYQAKGKYQQAQACLKEYVQITDSLNKEEFDKKIGLLAVASQEKILIKQKEKEVAAVNRRNSLQYIGITIGIVIIFILLTLMGFLKMSSRTIRILGFFSFLMFFEFLFLLFKKKFEFFTHGEPLRELFIMIILAAILIPLHHWVEKKVIHYLTNQKGLATNGTSWWHRLFTDKKPVPEEVKEIK